MNYKIVYDKLIAKAKERGIPDGYSEKHHIVPKSLGGTNSKDNIVRLTAKEHMFAHKLLVRITEGEDKKKMQRAFFFMFYSNNPNRDVNLSDLAKAREEYGKSLRGVPAKNKGKKMNLSDEVRRKLRETGRKNLQNADNTNYVVCRNLDDDSFVRVPRDIFLEDDNLVGATLGRKYPNRKRVSFVETFPDEDQRSKVFGRRGDDNGSSSRKSLLRYGEMTDEEFEDWCSDKTPRGIKRATTFRKQYKETLTYG